MKQIPIYIFFILLIIPAGQIHSQKKPIDLSSLDQWEGFRERKISYDGKWVAFATTPTSAKPLVLRLKNMQSQKQWTFNNAAYSRFASDSRSFACVKQSSTNGASDTTVVIHLSNGYSENLVGANSFNWADSTSNVKAWLSGPQDQQLLKVSTEKGEVLLAEKNVVQYRLTPMGDAIYYTIKDSGGMHLIFTDLLHQNIDTLIKGQQALGALFYDGTFERLVIPVTDVQKTSLVLYNHKRKEITYLPIESKTGDTGYVVNTQTKVQFLKGSSRILYTTQYAYPIRSGKPLEGEARVEVWSYSDRQIYTKQKKELRQQLEKPYHFCYDPVTKSIIQVTSLETAELQLPEYGSATIALVTSDLLYQSQAQWDPVIRRDAYLINLHTGESKLVAKGKAADFKLSPYGNYVIWFDRNKQHYYTYSAATGLSKQIDKGITDEMVDTQPGMPQDPEPFGIAQWEEDDRSVLITTVRDVWKADPSGTRHATNITAAFAKRQGIQFSFYLPWRQASCFTNEDTLLFYGVAEKSKEAGFFAVQPAYKQSPKQLLFGKYAFSFPGMDIAGNGRQILLSFGTNNYYGLFYSTDLKQFDTLYLLNPQQKDYNWYKGELIKWQVRKGVYTEGALYKPENFDPNKKYPLIIWMYENGHAKDFNSYILPQWSAAFINFAFYASNGYVVFVPDIPYRIGKPGESAYEAVITGVDHLQKQGWIDTANMGLQSHSWGGYEVAYILTQTNRFKAASAGAVVSNMTSAYGGIRSNLGESRQWIYEKHQSRLGASLWQRPELYIQNSPLFSANNITTPLLLVHNEQDGGVSFSQGIEFFSALKRLNKQVWLLNYPEENHVLRALVNKKDFTYRMFYFFEHFLKGRPAPEWMSKGISAIEQGYTKGYE